MELGLHIADFSWNGGTPELGPTLGRLAVGAEDAGIARLTVMDHVWQIEGIGPPEDPMLEAYTTLGYLAGITRRVRLHALVTAVVYREPGLLAKMVTTLDVLSGGRAGLGIGAAWNEAEARGLGLHFPSTRERFERLDEVVPGDHARIIVRETRPPATSKLKCEGPLTRFRDLRGQRGAHARSRMT